KPTVALVSAGRGIGVDRGVDVAVATSDGDLINRKNWRPKERERLRRLERSRERQHSARLSYNKQARKEGSTIREHKSKKQQEVERAIAVMHARARRRRKDFAEQVSNDLAKNHNLIVFEDLHLPAMTRSARGTKDKPGKRVKQKSGLNRAMLDKGLGLILARSLDKAKRHGHYGTTVPAPYTSITCPRPECRHVDPANRASRSVFCCVKCGYRAHADINAAEEIRERGIKLALAGGTPVAARQGTNLDTGKPVVESGAVKAGQGNGNQEMGYITVWEVA
ncbi:MAG: RNA-guided endonuclease InsQ/TnpB family protein, partial [Acidimicrobiales bacterium]